MLESVARRGLLVVLNVVADLEGGARGTQTSSRTWVSLPSTSCSRAALSVPQSPGSLGRQLFSCPQGRHVLGGGGPCCTLRGAVFLRGCDGLVRHRNLLCSGNSGLGRRWPRPFDDSLDYALSDERWQGLDRSRLRASCGFSENPLRRLRRGGGRRTTSTPILTRRQRV
jgi:hypothetical protein